MWAYHHREGERSVLRNQGRTFSFALALVALIAGLALAGCAPTKQVQVKESVLPGFLPRPELLQPGEGSQPSLVYLRPDTDWSAYTKLLIEPIIIVADKADGGGDDVDDVPPEQRQVLASAMHGYIYDAAAQHCEMVDIPSPGTIILRLALVEANASNPTLNTVSSYIPQLNMLTRLSSYAFNSGVGYFVGGATGEGYAIDGGSGELLWEGVDRRVGTQAFGSNTMDSWADVDKTFRAWADTFSERIVKLGMCSKTTE